MSSCSDRFFLCLVCNQKVEFQINDPSLEEKLLTLFWIFCGHMKVDCECTEDFDFLTEPFPVCKICLSELVELSRCHRKISSSTLKEEKIAKIVAGLTFKIINTIEGNNDADDDDSSQFQSHIKGEHGPVKEDEQPNAIIYNKLPTKVDKGEDDEVTEVLKRTRSKILSIRKSIYNAYNVVVVVDSIDPDSEKEKLLLQLQPSTTTTSLSSESEYEENTAKDSNLNTENNDADVTVVEPEDPLSLENELLEDDIDFDYDRDDDELSNESLDEDQVAAKLFPDIIELDDDGGSGGTNSDYNVDDDYDDTSYNVKSRKRRKVKRGKSSKSKKSKSSMQVNKKKSNIERAVVEVSPDKFLYRDKFYFERKDDTYTCSTCYYSTKFYAAISNHVRCKHFNVNKYKCKYCVRHFNRRSDCTRHEERHEQRRVLTLDPVCRSEIIPLPGDTDGTRKFLYKNLFPFEIVEESYKCGSCSHIAATRSNITSHIRNVHLNAGKFECKLCEKKFNRKYDLERHELTHAVTNNFLCQSCGQAFKTPQLLKMHEMTHQGIDPRKHPCEYCGARFYKRQMLTRHVIMKHTKEKPYECDICSKRYGLQDSMKKHRISHMDVLPFMCHICGLGQATNSEVLRHIALTHDKTLKRIRPPQQRRRKKAIPPTTTTTIITDSVIESAFTETSETAAAAAPTNTTSSTVAIEDNNINTINITIPIEEYIITTVAL